MNRPAKSRCESLALPPQADSDLEEVDALIEAIRAEEFEGKGARP